MLEYRQTRRITRKISVELSKKIGKLSELLASYKALVGQPNVEGIESLKDLMSTLQDKLQIRIQSLKNQIRSLQDELKIRNETISSLTFIIEWLTTGRQPGTTRGIENRAAYDREVSFENSWIQKRADHRQDIPLEIEDDEILNEIQFKNQTDEKLVKQIISSFTPRQKEVLELIANDYSQAEVGEMLGVTQQAVSDTIARYKQKVIDEGWFMV